MSYRSQAVVIIIIIFSCLVIILPVLPGHRWDNFCWMTWSTFIHQQGLTNVYDSGTDYVPLYHYVLWAYAKIAGSEEAIQHNVHYLRVVTLVMDLLGLWYVYKWLERKGNFSSIVLICFLNIAYVYNTVIWGQVDGILTTLVFMSLYYGYKGKPLLSGIFFLLAINFKVQAVVFLPLWGLLYINNIINKPRITTVLLPLLAMAALQTLILFPFLLKEGGLQQVWNVVIGSVDKFPMVGLGSRNMWNWFLRGDTGKLSDATVVLGSITYKQIGLCLFFITSFFVLLPMLQTLVKKLRQRNRALTITSEQVWLTGALLSMCFYYFNTQMHERYIHPAFIFITAYSLYKRDFFPYILFSIAYFLNLEGEMQWMRVESYGTLIFEYLFISILYFVVMVYLYVKLIRSSGAVNSTSAS